MGLMGSWPTNLENIRQLNDDSTSLISRPYTCQIDCVQLIFGDETNLSFI